MQVGERVLMRELHDGRWGVREVGPELILATYEEAMRHAERLYETWPEEAPTRPKAKRSSKRPPPIPERE